MPNPLHVARLRWLSCCCSILGGLLGLLAFVGWVADNEALRGSLVAGITMKTNASICVALMGLLIALRRWEPLAPDSPRARFETACGLLVFGTGLLTLAQHALGVNFGIDELLFEEQAGATATQSPNRMGPVASFCLSTLALGRLLMDTERQRGRALFQYLAVLVILIASIPLLGFLYRAHALFGIGKYTGIAMPTAAALWLLGAGLLLSRPDVGFTRRLIADDSGALLVRRLLPAAILIPLVLMLLRIVGQDFGLYDLGLGRALLVLAFIVVFTTLVWRTGDVVYRQANRAASAERELHERLVHSLEQFRTLGEAVPDLLWMTDGQGEPLYQNPAWARYTGIKQIGLQASGWLVIAHPDDSSMMQELWTEASVSAVPFQLEARLRRHDGSYKWFSVRTVPVRDEKDVVVKWIGAATDIDDQKRTQHALADANRRKTEFLAVLAHELRNPLAPVRNGVHLLRSRDNADPDRARTYALIERQIDHLSRLIDDLMDVSRITRDQLELRKSHANLSQIVAGAVDGSRYVIDAHQHSLQVSLPSGHLHIEVDSARLNQVLINLLTNAARYTPAGGEIRLSVDVGDGGELVISVSDSGIGIGIEQMPHLFEMFFQAERDDRRAQHGLGIGLALVKKLVELHGGRISASSPGPGQGSTFTVKLPAKVILSAPEVPPSKPALSLPKLQSLRVLVVEDNQDSAEVLVSLLELTGAKVQSANDGETALSIADEFHPQVVLLDIGLPGISGYDVARAIREASWSADTFIVALTGWGQPDDRARSKEVGIDRHMVKPVNPETLIALIRDYGQKSTPVAAGVSSAPHP